MKTIHVNNVEQFSLYIRCKDEDKFNIIEKFFEFMPLDSITGLGMLS